MAQGAKQTHGRVSPRSRAFSLGLGPQAGQADNTARGGVGPRLREEPGVGPQAGQADKRPGVGGPASGRSLGLGPQAGQADIAQAGRITKLALVPEEVRPDDGRQLGFWGNDAGAASRAARALARVQGLLGPEAAMTGILQGGRDYTEQVRLVPWGEPRVPLRPGVLTGGDTARGGVGRPRTSGSKGPPGATRRRVAGRSPSDFSEGAPEQSLPPVQRTAGDSSETQLPGSFSLGLGPQAGQADNTARGGVGAPPPGGAWGWGPRRAKQTT